MGPTTPTSWPGLIGEIHVLQDLSFSVIAKRDMIEDDLAPERTGFLRVWLLRDDRFVLQDRLHSLNADGCSGNNIGHLGEILNGLEELAQVGEKYGQCTSGHFSRQDSSRAAPQNVARCRLPP